MYRLSFYCRCFFCKSVFSVQVTISTQIRDVSCYQYEPKFQLEQEVFSFDQHNYNVPQSVTIIVHRLNSSYEGPFSASFEHKVSTEDENFGAAFLRPVTVVVQDDSSCVKNAQQYEKEKIRKCGCMEGFFVEQTDPNFCDTVTSCQACPRGMLCGFQQLPELAIIEEEFFRADPASTNVVKCPDPATQCIGNAISGNSLCAEGHEGAFCMVCALEVNRRFVRNGDKCLECSGSSRSTTYAALVVLVALCMGVLVFVSRDGRSENDKSQPIADRLGEFGEKVTVKYKILVTFSQIMQKVATEYPMQLPQKFKTFWANFTFLNLDLSLLPINCIINSNFHDRLVATCIAPMIFVAGVAIFWGIQRQILIRKGGGSHSRSLNKLTAKSIRVCIMFLYTIFVSLLNLFLYSQNQFELLLCAHSQLCPQRFSKPSCMTNGSKTARHICQLTTQSNEKTRHTRHTWFSLPLWQSCTAWESLRHHIVLCVTRATQFKNCS
jgi:hypothetical protein